MRHSPCSRSALLLSRQARGVCGPPLDARRLPSCGAASASAGYGASPEPQGDAAGAAAEEAQRESAVVPTVLQWSQGGHSVYVTGSFNAWGERIPLRRASGNDCVVCLNLLPGTYQYKFIVDNEWRFAADQPTVRDEMGNINNCITVEDQNIFMREEQPSGFFNDNLYTQALPDEITMAKEPPQAPTHLWCLPLNFPTLQEHHCAGTTLLPPLGVTITHLMVSDAAHTSTISVSQRVRHKYITLVFVKPSGSSAALPSGAAESLFAGQGAAAAALGPGGHPFAGQAQVVHFGGFSQPPQPPLSQGMDVTVSRQESQTHMDVG